jgi:hypothetical protein
MVAMKAVTIPEYHQLLNEAEQKIANQLHALIVLGLPEAEGKLWHGHPVWFLDGNPIVGYSKEKRGIRLMFWSGADFEEEELAVRGTKFKDASVFYTSDQDIQEAHLLRWLEKSKAIQWDYKNLVKRKGQLVRIL